MSFYDMHSSVSSRYSPNFILVPNKVYVQPNVAGYVPYVAAETGNTYNVLETIRDKG